jgi:hypothetical protein
MDYFPGRAFLDIAREDFGVGRDELKKKLRGLPKGERDGG